VTAQEAATLAPREGYQPLRLSEEGRHFLGKQQDGRCSYLTPETRCSIHEASGYQAKPQTCRDFPFHAVATPAGVYVGLSFLCSAVAQGLGTSLESRRQELQQRFADPSQEVPERWLLWGELALDWDSYQIIEDHLSRHSERDPVDGPVVAAVRLAYVVREGNAALLQGEGIHPDFPLAYLNLLRGLLTVIETSGQPLGRMEEVLQALYSGQPYWSRALHCEIDSSRFGVDIPPWFGAQAQRYLQHLLFRKNLMLQPDVLSRACLFALIPQALLFFTRAHAQSRGREPEVADFHQALAILEGNLMLHAHGMESYFTRCAEVFLERA